MTTEQTKHEDQSEGQREMLGMDEWVHMGYQAFLNGALPSDNPYKSKLSECRSLWETGWEQAMRDVGHGCPGSKPKP